MKTLILFFVILFSFGVNAATLEWVVYENCDNIHAYHLTLSDREPYRVGSVICPTNQIQVLNRPGWYFVTAEDENGESLPSNHVLLAQYYFNSIRFEYDANGRLLYKGEHQDHDAVTDDVNWVVTKYYYTDSFISHMRIRITSWDDRATGW